MKTKFISFVLALVAAIALVNFNGCTSASEELVEEFNSLAERRMTRSSVESDADSNIDFPDAKEILSAVSSDMDAAWRMTLSACSKSGRQEFGFYIYYDVKTKKIFAGSLISGSQVPNSTISGASIDMGSYSETDDLKVCGVFHTHTSLQYVKIPCGRDVGPSPADENFSNSKGLPGFVYDYESNIRNGDSKTRSAKIYIYGPLSRE